MSSPSPRLRAIRLFVLVALGYYVCARLGFVLRLPPATTSVLWPPNSFLTAVLLLVPRRLWWVALSAALPAHVLVELQAGFPVPLVAALFVTNGAEALLAAVLVHRWSGGPVRFDTLRGVTAFAAGGVVLAPLATSFADAAVVHWIQGESYGLVWVRRAFSNSLSALILVPALFMGVREARSWLRAPGRRCLEASLVTAGLVLVGLLVFVGFPLESPHLPGGPYTALPLLLPFLIFAAVRFGPAGASLSLLTTALLAIATALAGWTPLRALPVEERVLGLQVFLIVVGVPLLLVSALIEERREAEQVLSGRLVFEELLSQLSGAFVHRQGRDMNQAFEAWLERLGHFLGVDRTALFRLSDDQQWFEHVSSWRRDGPAPPERLPRAAFPQGAALFLKEDPLVIPDVETLPTAFAADQDLLRRHGVRALVALPLLTADRPIGVVSFAATSGPRAWSQETVRRCRLVADVFAGALGRQTTEDALREREAEAQKNRLELAHALRVSTIGELTTSLAHELNQPLAAILASAQAARRLLSPPNGVHPEVREILEEIIDEDKRAGEVIHRLRELLRKGETVRVPLDLNRLVRDVVKLLANEMLIRGVSLREDLAPGPLTTRGDGVQIRQVILNLLINAVEALSEVDGDRRVVVRTEACRSGQVRVSVEDSGPGLRNGNGEEIFKPFYTTKDKGMGMGLSIARSILESHGGTIGARNNPVRGATFTFALPVPAASFVDPT